MRFLDVFGNMVRARLQKAAGDVVGLETVQDPTALQRVLSGLMRRTAALETRVPPEGIEIEVDLPDGGTTVYLSHGFTGPVRWYVVDWKEG